LKDDYGHLIDFLCQISKLSYFNLLDLADFLMHHYFPVSFFDVATLGVRYYSCTPVLAICASFRASSLIGSSGRLIITAHTSLLLF